MAFVQGSAKSVRRLGASFSLVPTGVVKVATGVGSTRGSKALWLPPSYQRLGAAAPTLARLCLVLDCLMTGAIVVA